MEIIQPTRSNQRSLRKRFTVKEELKLALLPTTVILLVYTFVEVLSNQKLLFASLASSAFLIYLDPHHGTNRVRTLIISQLSAAGIGLLCFQFIGPHYSGAALAMTGTIILMILADAMHPPAVATALSFAFRGENEDNLLLFGLAVLITSILVLLSRAMVWLMAKKKLAEK